MNSRLMQDRTAVLDELTNKQRRYVESILSGKTKFAAALAAGYSEETARNARAVIEREPVCAALQQLAHPDTPSEQITEQAPEAALQAQPQEETVEAASETNTDAEQLLLEERRRRAAQHGLAPSFEMWGNRTAWAVVRVPTRIEQPVAGPFDSEEEALAKIEQVITRERANR